MIETRTKHYYSVIYTVKYADGSVHNLSDAVVAKSLAAAMTKATEAARLNQYLVTGISVKE